MNPPPVPKRGAVARAFLVLACALATLTVLNGCAFLRLLRSERLKAPEVTYLRTVVKTVAGDRAEVDFVINATNPNKIGIRNVTVDYELFHEGRAFLKGSGLDVNLAPAGDTEIRIPVVITYSSVFSTAYALTQRILAGDSTVPVRLEALVAGKPTVYNDVEEGALFSFSRRLSRTENIPLPAQADRRRDRRRQAPRHGGNPQEVLSHNRSLLLRDPVQDLACHGLSRHRRQFLAAGFAHLEW